MTSPAEERLERLERELSNLKRRHRWLMVSAGLGLATVVSAWTWEGAVGPASAEQLVIRADTIRASTFLVDNGQGEVRALLDANESEGARLVLLGSEGKVHAAFEVTGSVPSVSLLDEAGAVRAGINVEEHANVSLSDQTGRQRITLAAVAAGPKLQLTDSNGEVRAILGATDLGPGFNMYDKQGTLRGALGVVESGPALELRDEAGTMRAAIGAVGTRTSEGDRKAHPESSLLLAGPDGSVVWSAPR